MSYRILHQLLHRLWTRAVGTPGYDKADWKRLELLLDELWRKTGEPFDLTDPPERRSVWERLQSWDL